MRKTPEQPSGDRYLLNGMLRGVKQNSSGLIWQAVPEPQCLQPIQSGHSRLHAQAVEVRVVDYRNVLREFYPHQRAFGLKVRRIIVKQRD